MVKTFLTVAVLLISIPTGAFACINGVLLRGEEAVRAAKRLERLLLAGKYQALIDEVEEYDHVEPASLAQHVELLRLTAVVRQKSRQKPALRSGVSRVIYELQKLQRRRPDDPLIQARLSEALALSLGSLDEAQELLEELSKRDLMPDAEAWATLAYVRRAAQDGAGSADALARCRRIAGRRLRACAAPVS